MASNTNHGAQPLNGPSQTSTNFSGPVGSRTHTSEDGAASTHSAVLNVPQGSSTSNGERISIALTNNNLAPGGGQSYGQVDIPAR